MILWCVILHCRACCTICTDRWNSTAYISKYSSNFFPLNIIWHVNAGSAADPNWFEASNLCGAVRRTCPITHTLWFRKFWLLSTTPFQSNCQHRSNYIHDPYCRISRFKKRSYPKAVLLISINSWLDKMHLASLDIQNALHSIAFQLGWCNLSM